MVPRILAFRRAWPALSMFALCMWAGCAGPGSQYLVRRVNNNSMAPAIPKGQRIRIDRAAYTNGASFKRWDVVCFKIPHISGYTVKRIVALPDETITISGRNIWINGVELEIPGFLEYKSLALITSPATKAHTYGVKLGSDQLYVIGDNSARSADSRSYGPISINDIIGKVEVGQRDKEVTNEDRVTSPYSIIE
jgi:signal peptidase I